VSDYSQRFGGIRRLYGEEPFRRLKEVHVCIIGLGGVGSWAAEALARSGVGHLTLIDFDEICVTNVNRQLHAVTDTVGEKKHRIMAQRVTAINPECHCHTIELRHRCHRQHQVQGGDHLLLQTQQDPHRHHRRSGRYR